MSSTNPAQDIKQLPFTRHVHAEVQLNIPIVTSQEGQAWAKNVRADTPLSLCCARAPFPLNDWNVRTYLCTMVF
jgi:hypothetical protein